MTWRALAAPALAAALAVGVAAGAHAAIREGTTDSGAAWRGGGVSHEELVALRAQRNRYSLWITTAARKSGAYIADVGLVVKDAAGLVLFDDRLPGPWFFIDLPPGRYEIEATYREEKQRRRTTIARGGRQQMVLYFATGDEVSPENTSPFEDNPYGEKRIGKPPPREQSR